MERVSLALATYRAIRDRILSQDPDLDEETLADTVEGLTDLHEILAAIVRSALTDEAFAVGLTIRMEEMHTRLARLQDRASKRRQIAREAMVEADIKKIAAPDFTASVRPGTPSLTVADEAAIPAEFWLAREPRLDRQALLLGLKQGAKISGVELSNPEPVLSVRSR